MLPTTCVVVPTYWTRAGGDSRPGDAVYDHPTPLGGSSTLPALLESLEKLDTESFYFLVLVGVTGEDAVEDAERRVGELVAECPKLKTLLFGPSHLAWLTNWLNANGLTYANSFLDLRNYPKIRNLQLVIPHVLHSRAIVALDDDEIVTDQDFLPKAIEPLGRSIDGVRVDGLSGHYLQENGSILLQVDPAKAKATNIFDRKAAIMNAATEKLESQSGNLVETPFCFGGNMEFSAELAASVGFDPEITRGEDIDYLINARVEGRHFFLRKDLHILHRPPKGGSYKDVSTSKLEQDIIRFMYEQAKLVASQAGNGLRSVTASELSPYPGDFLDRDIESDAVEALIEAGYASDPRDFVGKVRASLADKVQRYLRFRREWPALMDAMSRADSVNERLSAEVRGL
jgi:hypothetical protein